MVCEVVDGVLSLRSQAPLCIHAEGEEENVTVLALLLVVRSLDSIGVIDNLVDALRFLTINFSRFLFLLVVEFRSSAFSQLCFDQNELIVVEPTQKNPILI
jgi:hypothetical protein